MLMPLIKHTVFRKLMSIFLLSLALAGCSHEGFKRFIMVPAAVEREDRERELKANSLVVPPKWHQSPSKAELAEKPNEKTDAPLFTADKKRNPEAVEPDIEKERQDERVDTVSPGSER